MVQWNKHRGYVDVMTPTNENGKQPERIPFSGALPQTQNHQKYVYPPLQMNNPMRWSKRIR